MAYVSSLDILETEIAIKKVKDFFKLWVSVGIIVVALVIFCYYGTCRLIRIDTY